jgi:hypothetical protein
MDAGPRANPELSVTLPLLFDQGAPYSFPIRALLQPDAIFNLIGATLLGELSAT